MKAWILNKPAPVSEHPLHLSETAVPTPSDDELLLRVGACGICRTDLHVVEGDLPVRRSPDFRNYVILGACNPPLAYKTLQQEIAIGLLLPCNVVVYETDEKGKSVVAAIDAKTMLSVVGANSATINAVAAEVNEKLQRVVAQL